MSESDAVARLQHLARQMEKLSDSDDLERAHVQADDLLVEALHALAGDDADVEAAVDRLAAAYGDLTKWYV